MGFFKNKKGDVQHVELDLTVYNQAKAENKTVAQVINSKFAADVDDSLGTAFQQICASNGLTLVGANPFGLKNGTVADILDGSCSFQAGPANTKDRPDPWGNQSRLLFPSAVLEMVEDMFYDSRADDDVVFRDLVKTTVSIAGDTYRQPVLSYQTAGGPNAGALGAKASRVTQLGEVPNILKITTSDRNFTIPAYGIGIEMSQEAMKGTTLDMFGLTVKRYVDIEHNARVYGYLSSLFLGDVDRGTSAITAVTTTALDSAATGGVVTHKSWIKFLARNRRRRKITHVMCDLDTYLKIEGRTGRPGSNNYDPSLARLDPQITPVNSGMVGFGNDVKWWIVDDAANGGPVPANTVWALDQSQAIKLIKNTEADFKATEEFVLRRASRMVWTWAEEVDRLFGETDQMAFDVLTIA
jgi:hypothetical protein